MTDVLKFVFSRTVAAPASQSSFEMSKKTHAVSSFMINIEDLPRKIARVIDFKFLDGYNDPTLVILYESLPTWTGRIAERQVIFQRIFCYFFA